MESNNEEKRVFHGYEVLHSFHIGDRELLLGINKKEELPYLLADCYRDNDFGIERYEDAMGGDDYLEIMELFSARLARQLEQVRMQRTERAITAEQLTGAYCIAGSNRSHYENQVVIIAPSALRAEYATMDYQLVLAHSGNGCNPNGRGQAVFCTNIYTGENNRWQRYDILGIANMEKIPQWAKEKAEKLVVIREKAQAHKLELER